MATTRDQERARHAYKCVGDVEEGERAEYKVLVNSLGAAVMRSGLSAALAFIERELDEKKPKAPAANTFFDHLGSAGIPGLKAAGKNVPKLVRELELDDYMLATREVLKLTIWFRRAVQALFADEPSAKPSAGGAA